MKNNTLSLKKGFGSSKFDGRHTKLLIEARIKAIPEPKIFLMRKARGVYYIHYTDTDCEVRLITPAADHKIIFQHYEKRKKAPRYLFTQKGQATITKAIMEEEKEYWKEINDKEIYGEGTAGICYKEVLDKVREGATNIINKEVREELTKSDLLLYNNESK